MKKYIVYFKGRKALVSSIDESIVFITSQGVQKCDEQVLQKLSLIFTEQIKLQSGVSLSSGNEKIFLFEALGETLEEHTENYNAKNEAIKINRMIRKQNTLRALETEKEGWYQSTIYFLRIPEHPGAPKRRCVHTRDIYAKSGIDAYNKMSIFLHERFNDIYEPYCPEPVSKDVEILFVENQDLH